MNTLVGWEAVITLAIQSYQEREKAKQDSARAQQIIDSIIGEVQRYTNMVLNKLEEMRMERLKGTYTGLLLNFREYDPIPEDESWIESIAYDANIILGELQVMYDNESNFQKVVDIVSLMLLVSSLRALAMSERKYTYGVDKDKEIIVMFEKLIECLDWIINKQQTLVDNLFNTWKDCDENFERIPDTVCLPPGGEAPPTGWCRCDTDWFIYRVGRDNLKLYKLNKENTISSMELIRNGA